MSLDGKLIFVGGAPRSGTTLVRNVLDSHPDVCSGREFDLVPSIVRLWWAAAQKVESGRISDYLSQEQLQESFSHLIDSLLEPYRTRREKPHIAEKTPSNILVFPLLRRLLPQAYLVHVVRDGRDVVSSMLAVGSRYRRQRESAPEFARHIESAAKTWTQYVSAPMADQKVFRSSEFQERYIEVRYEDIVHCPEATLKQLCAGLGIDFSPTMLSPDLYPHDGAIEGIWYTEEMMSAPIHDSSTGRWRRDLTLFQRIVVARYCQSYLQHFGYADDSKWVWDSSVERLASNPVDDCLTVARLICKWLARRLRLSRTWIWKKVR